MMGGVHMWWNSILKNSTRCERSPHVVGGVHTLWDESPRGGSRPDEVGRVHTWWQEGQEQVRGEDEHLWWVLFPVSPLAQE